MLFIKKISLICGLSIEIWNSFVFLELCSVVTFSSSTTFCYKEPWGISTSQIRYSCPGCISTPQLFFITTSYAFYLLFSSTQRCIILPCFLCFLLKRNITIPRSNFQMSKIFPYLIKTTHTQLCNISRKFFR